MPKAKPKKTTKPSTKAEVAAIEVGPTNPHIGEGSQGTAPRVTLMKVADLVKWDKNPRNIKKEDFEKLKLSLTKNPEFMFKRPLLVNHTKGKYIVYAGNMRLAAMQAMGWELTPVVVENDIPEDRMNEEAIKDNVEYGQWDMDLMSENFSEAELKEMCLPEREMWLFELNENVDQKVNVPTGNKNPFQQQTYILASEQAEFIQQCIAEVIKTDEYKYMVTHGNQNSNGNALSLIVEQWAQQKTL